MFAFRCFAFIETSWCLLADFVVEVCNALVGPVFPQGGQDMTQCVRPKDKHTEITYIYVCICLCLHVRHPPGDGSIYVRDDDLVIPVPEVDGALTATGSLVLSGHAKHSIVRAILQLEGQLCVCVRERETEKDI